jgi:hypothetical protein
LSDNADDKKLQVLTGFESAAAAAAAAAAQ